MKKVTRKYVNHNDSDCVAASTIPLPMRSTRSFASNSFNPTSGSKRAWADRIREKLPSLGEHEYEVLWERGVLGVIFLESEKDGIPYVSKATESCISEAVCPGDILKYVNIVCSKDHSFSDFFKILATMKKPVLLRFERVLKDESDKRRKRNSIRSRSSTSLSSVRHEQQAVEEKKEDLVESIKSMRSNSLPPNDAIIHPKSIRSSFWRSNKNPVKTEGAHVVAPKPPLSGSVAIAQDKEDTDTILFDQSQECGEVKPGRITRSISVSTIPDKDTQKERMSDTEYEVVWTTGSLGLFFGEHRVSHLPIVTRSSASLDPAIQAKVEIGDLLLKANDLHALDCSFEDFFARLQQISKPVRLIFRRSTPEENRSRHSASPKMIAKMLNDLDNVRDSNSEVESTDSVPSTNKVEVREAGDILAEKVFEDADEDFPKSTEDQVVDDSSTRSDHMHRDTAPESDDESVSDDEEAISHDHSNELIEECPPDSTDADSENSLCEEIGADDKITNDPEYDPDQVLHSVLSADTADTIPLDIMVDQDPDVSRDHEVDAVMPTNSSECSSQSNYLTKSPFANMANLSATVARYRRKSKHSREVNKLPAITETTAHTVPLVAPHAVNTTVQVRGRSRSKSTFSDTPDSATYLVKWKENFSIGFQVREARLARGVFPLIVGVCRNSCCEALRHVCIGDIILEINGKDTSSMGVKKTASFIRACSKTALIKLRHGPGFVSERVSAYV